MLCLVARSGLSRNRSWALNRDGITVGRGNDCTVVVGDPTVSRRHCRIYELPIAYEARRFDEGKKIGWRDGLAALWYIVKYNLFG